MTSGVFLVPKNDTTRQKTIQLGRKRYNSAEKSNFSNFSQTVPNVQKWWISTFWVPRVSGFGQYGQKIEFFDIFPNSPKCSEMLFLLILVPKNDTTRQKWPKNKNFRNFSKHSQMFRNYVHGRFSTQKQYNSAEMTKKPKFSKLLQTFQNVQKWCVLTF